MCIVFDVTQNVISIPVSVCQAHLGDEDKEFKASMERFLNDCDDKDNDPELVKEEEVVEEVVLVTTLDQKANHENVEVIIETNNDLQNRNYIEEKRSKR